MEIITSKDNKLIKEIKKLKEKKYREEENAFIVEGVKMVEEAIDYKAEIKNIVVSEDALGYEISEELLNKISSYNFVIVSQGVFSTISDVQTPQGILAVIKSGEEKAGVNYDSDLILYLDNIQDPGNLGTILRTADAVGLKQVIISSDTVDPFNPKVVRSTMGAIFRINIIKKDDIEDFKNHGYKIAITSLGATKTIYEADFNKTVIVIGNEANGVSKEVEDISDEKLIIPMEGKAESLNAAVATSIILYENYRRKI